MTTSNRSRTRVAGAERDRGAVLVEFAILALPLFIILFGIIEFGNAYSQNLEVRHGAREGSRLVAVNYQPTAAVGATQTDLIRAEVCDRMGASSTTSVQFLQTGSAAGTGRATVIVERPLQQLTQFLDPFLGGVVLSSEVETRLEQDATWAPDATPEPCP